MLVNIIPVRIALFLLNSIILTVLASRAVYVTLFAEPGVL